MIAQGAKNGGKMTITMSKKVTKATLQKTTNSMKFAVNIDTSNLNKGSRVQGFKGSRVQGFNDCAKILGPHTRLRQVKSAI